MSYDMFINGNGDIKNKMKKLLIIGTLLMSTGIAQAGSMDGVMKPFEGYAQAYCAEMGSLHGGHATCYKQQVSAWADAMTHWADRILHKQVSEDYATAQLVKCAQAKMVMEVIDATEVNQCVRHAF